MTAHDDRDTGYVSYMLRMWRKRDSAGQPVATQPGRRNRPVPVRAPSPERPPGPAIAAAAGNRTDGR